MALTLLLGLSGGKLASEAFSLKNLAGNLMFLQAPASVRGAWFVPYGENYPLWSLSFEMFFYLLFPLVALLLKLLSKKKVPHSSAVAFLLVAGFSILSLLFYNLVPNPLALFASHFVIWYLGVELAEVRLGHRRPREALAVFAGVASLFWVAAYWTGSASLGNVAIGFGIFLIWRGAQLVPLRRYAIVSGADGLLYRVFGGLGLISYAVYLFHYPIMRFMSGLISMPLLGLAIAVGLTIGLAYAAEWMATRPAYGFLRLRYVR